MFTPTSIWNQPKFSLGHISLIGWWFVFQEVHFNIPISYNQNILVGSCFYCFCCLFLSPKLLYCNSKRTWQVLLLCIQYRSCQDISLKSTKLGCTVGQPGLWVQNLVPIYPVDSSGPSHAACSWGTCAGKGLCALCKSYEGRIVGCCRTRTSVTSSWHFNCVTHWQEV